jgi:hypothetical protein
LEVKAATNLIVVPLDKVRKGHDVSLQVTLYDDEGKGIAGANLGSSRESRRVPERPQESPP